MVADKEFNAVNLVNCEEVRNQCRQSYKIAFLSTMQLMKKKSNAKRKMPIDKGARVRKTGMPVDSYEAWLKGQSVKRVTLRPEVQVPLDPYETWIRNQVQKRLRLQK